MEQNHQIAAGPPSTLSHQPAAAAKSSKLPEQPIPWESPSESMLVAPRNGWKNVQHSKVDCKAAALCFHSMIVHLAFIRLICHLPQLQQCRTGKGFNKKHVNQKCNTVAPQSHKRQSKKKLSLQWHFSNRCGSNASKKHPFVEHDQKRGSASRMPFFHSKQRKKRKKMAR